MARPDRFAPEKVLPRIRGVAETIAGSLGAQAISVEFVRESGQTYLRVLLQEPGGTRIQTCEKVSRALSRELDALDFIPINYFLEVSSPGLSGPVEIPADAVPQPDEAAPGKEETL